MKKILVFAGILFGGAVLITGIDAVVGFHYQTGIPSITHQVATMLFGAALWVNSPSRN